MKKINYLLIALSAGACTLFSACHNDKKNNSGNSNTKNEVIIHELADADKLNPITSTSANATYIETNIFMYLLDADKKTLTIKPSLAKSRPVVKEITEGPYAGGLSMEYEIRPEATWDNGQPVLATDVEFTYKCVLDPAVDNEHLRPYLDFLSDFKIDPTNPKKFTVYSNKKYYLAEFSSGNIFIMPEYVYDPGKVLRKYSLKDIANPAMADKLKNDKENLAFAQEFNSQKFQRDKGSVVGCGPYNFESWVTGQRVILSKKKDWWGEKAGLKAIPEKITYEIINDWTAVSSSIRGERIDLAYGIRPKDFLTLQKEDDVKKNYNFFTPQEMSYVYVGINMRDKRLSDIAVRQALAHCVNQAEIIKNLVYDLATPSNSPILPSKSYYNKNLKPYNFDVELAKSILDKAGWVDSDNDGIRDKMINGQKQKLSFTIKYNSGNDTREKICLLMSENCKRAGIEITPTVKEWTVFLEETKVHNFDLYVGGWVAEAIGDDPKQIWHTASYNGGSNYVGFGNEKTDALIESLRAELDDNKRAAYFMEFQQIVHDEIPYIFLYSPKNRLAIHSRFEAEAYSARPGFNVWEFKQKANP
jgi:peptide/nickel transport system substrate-binding protein